MKTSNFINALVADRASISPSPGKMVAVAVVIGAVMTAALFLPLIGIRADLVSAALSPRFLAKFLLALSLAAGAIGFTTRLSSPEANSGPWGWVLGAVPLILVLAIAVELFLVPASEWKARLFGAHWLACLVLIPLCALPPLAGLLIALKRGAPRDGAFAGTFAGVAAGGVAAIIYVAHCPDDSPLFVAVWYTLAICIAAMLGYLAGKHWLKW